MNGGVVITVKCSPTDARKVCSARWIATNHGDMWFDAVRGGYCHKDITRTQSQPTDSDLRWKRQYYGLEDHTGEPYLLERCPFCSQPLPEAIVAGEAE